MRSLLPKMKKKLAAFFTDESGKISKENILSMGVGGMVLAGFIVENISASSHSDSLTHVSNVHSSGGPGAHVSSSHISSPVAGGHSSGIRNGSVYESPSGGHLSAGHVSGNQHSNHVNHSSGPGHASVNTGDDG